jgi:FkbM family methyltransferase
VANVPNARVGPFLDCAQARQGIKPGATVASSSKDGTPMDTFDIHRAFIGFGLLIGDKLLSFRSFWLNTIETRPRSIIRKLAPPRMRRLLASYGHARAIRKGQFGDVGDPHFEGLRHHVRPGDWVIDVGAAVGGYTLRFSELVGPEGRVFALEPTTTQFGLLMRNIERAKHQNITCLQAAVGSETAIVGMVVPNEAGAPNWYQAQIRAGGNLLVWCVPIDSLPIAGPVTFIKIDAEGHDYDVLLGARKLIERDRPVLLVEDRSQRVQQFMDELGYLGNQDNSNNALWTHRR